MLEKMQILLQYLLPKRWITHIIGLIASWEGGWITHYLILLFVRVYKIDMKEYETPKLTDYKTFNDFFARKLNKNARIIDTNPSTLIAPADGIISQIGTIINTQFFQIKGRTYNLDSLLAGHDNIINRFHDGNFVVTYIPPRNCHRIYMPCTGTLRETLYIPGELFSVHPKIIKDVPNILSRNEKIICLFETDFGDMAQILIGSIIVGSIETTWLGTITPPRPGIVKHWHYPSLSSSSSTTTPNNNMDNNDDISNNPPIILSKGQEMGLFKLGSTVINLFDNKQVYLNNQLKPNDITRIGMPLATRRNNKDNIHQQ